MEAKTRVLLRRMISDNILEHSATINKEYLAEEIARRWSRL